MPKFKIGAFVNVPNNPDVISETATLIGAHGIVLEAGTQPLVWVFAYSHTCGAWYETELVPADNNNNNNKSIQGHATFVTDVANGGMEFGPLSAEELVSINGGKNKHCSDCHYHYDGTSPLNAFSTTADEKCVIKPDIIYRQGCTPACKEFEAK